MAAAKYAIRQKRRGPRERARGPRCNLVGTVAERYEAAKKTSLGYVPGKERMKERTPRVDGAEWLKRTFDFDVLEHLGLPTAGC